jgi:CBS domain containing-hemolysin-like protein
MSPVLLAVAALSGAAAAAMAAADGALVALDRDAPPAAETPVGALYARRDHVRRALSFARILAHLITGVALGLALGLGGPPSPGDALVVLMLALLVTLAAETAPRAWGDRGGAGTLSRLRPIVAASEVVLSPITRVAERLDAWLLAVLPALQADDEDRETSAEHFRQVIAAEAEVTRAEERILQGVFTLGDTEVHEVMVPRVDIVGLDRDTRWSEVVDRVRSSEHSRFPVYEETIDEVVGVLHAKDLLPFILADEPPAAGWTSLMRTASFIPRTKLIGEQLRDFRAEGSHLAVVVDEYGGTAGLVTIEDVLEELVGEIRDEHDVEEPEVEMRDGRRYWVAGRVTLEELSELLEHDFEMEDVTTVGGLVYAHLGRVPRAGESFTLGGFRVVVERVRRRTVERVYFERLGQLAEESA